MVQKVIIALSKYDFWILSEVNIQNDNMEIILGGDIKDTTRHKIKLCYPRVLFIDK